jgi:hypothetical protein
MSLKVASVDAGAVDRTELQALIADSISKHQPMVIQRAFPHGIDVRQRNSLHHTIISDATNKPLERVVEVHGDMECLISQVRCPNSTQQYARYFTRCRLRMAK